jgi:sialate O-acetylesterase
MQGYGVFMEEGPADWQILQQEHGKADTTLSGCWRVRPEDRGDGAWDPRVMVRIVYENNNSPVLPWTAAETDVEKDALTGTWKLSLQIPAGGLYRIETGLSNGIRDPRVWLLRGDVRLHTGVGNVFIIAGQSNAAGYGRDSAWDPTHTDVHLLRNCGRWDLAAHPLNETTGAADAANAEAADSGTSPYLTFGRMFRALSGLPVGLVATALGGSPMRSWVNRQDGCLYRNMIRRIHEAGGHMAGILWYQGCSDTDTAEQAENYLSAFSEMVGDLRSDLGWDVPFFTFQLNRCIHSPNDSIRWSMVREAQREAAHCLKEVYVLPTIDCSISDLIHNRSSANVMLGERLASQCAAVLCGGRPWFAPDIESAAVQGNAVTLTFSNVTFGLETFSRLPEEYFCITDENGAVPISGWQTEGNEIRLLLSKAVQGDVLLSYESGSDPMQPPICDSTTYLPVLAFYNFPVQNN